MPLILAIEPDRRQAAKLSALAHRPPTVELVIGDTTEHAFQTLGARVPDLVLTPLLLSPKDEAALADRLRELDAAGAHVQTLVIPVLGSGGGETKRAGGLFGRLRRSQGSSTASDGCDPAVFGEQIREYLQRAAAENEALAVAQADLDAAWAEEPPAGPQMTALFNDDPQPGAATADEELQEVLLAAAEEEWEEVALEAAPSANPSVEFTNPARPAEPREEIAAETVDLDAFVRELHAGPATVDIAPALEVLEFEAAPLGLESLALDLDTAPFDLDSVADAPVEPAGLDAQAVEEPVIEPPAPRAEPVSAPRPASLFQVDWQDVLSAIRRDIENLRGEEAPPPSPRPKRDLFSEPLVFPPRPAVALPAPAVESPLLEERAPVLPSDGTSPIDTLSMLETGTVIETPAAPETGPAIDTPTAMEGGDASWALAANVFEATAPDAATEDFPAPFEPVAAASGPALDAEPADPLAATSSLAAALEIATTVEPAPDSVTDVTLPPAAAASQDTAAAVGPKSSKHKKKRRHAEAQAAHRSLDDWGFFDPQQVDFAALLAKLNEITDMDRHGALPGR